VPAQTVDAGALAGRILQKFCSRTGTGQYILAAASRPPRLLLGTDSVSLVRCQDAAHSSMSCMTTRGPCRPTAEDSLAARFRPHIGNIPRVPKKDSPIRPHLSLLFNGPHARCLPFGRFADRRSFAHGKRRSNISTVRCPGLPCAALRRWTGAAVRYLKNQGKPRMLQAKV